jgi:hypothetical protein
MRPATFHPLATVSAGSAAAALLLPFLRFDQPFAPQQVCAFLLLASPFFVLLLGHLYVAASWRRHVALVLANLPVWGAWLLAYVAMWYFQAGWYGVAVFSPAMAVLAGLLVLASSAIREPQHAKA